MAAPTRLELGEQRLGATFGHQLGANVHPWWRFFCAPQTQVQWVVRGCRPLRPTVVRRAQVCSDAPHKHNGARTWAMRGKPSGP